GGPTPAAPLPAWGCLRAGRAPGRRLRGIGEPIWAERTPEELVECQHHEGLLNLAFDGVAPMDLVCPYDELALGEDVVDEARRSHPIVLDGGSFRDCADYAGVEAVGAAVAKPLPDPPA